MRGWLCVKVLEGIQRKLGDRIARAASHGFAREYQNEREQEDNTICHKKLTPAALQDYQNTA